MAPLRIIHIDLDCELGDLLVARVPLWIHLDGEAIFPHPFGTGVCFEVEPRGMIYLGEELGSHRVLYDNRDLVYVDVMNEKSFEEAFRVASRVKEAKG